MSSVETFKSFDRGNFWRLFEIVTQYHDHLCLPTSSVVAKFSEITCLRICCVIFCGVFLGIIIKGRKSFSFILFSQLLFFSFYILNHFSQLLLQLTTNNKLQDFSWGLFLSFFTIATTFLYPFNIAGFKLRPLEVS